MPHVACTTCGIIMLKIPNLRTLELKLQFIRNQGDELGIGGLALGVAHGIAKEPLEGIQIPSVPGHLNGMADGPLHPGRGSAEGFRDLWIQDFCNGVRGPDGPRRGYQEPVSTQVIYCFLYRPAGYCFTGLII